MSFLQFAPTAAQIEAAIAAGTKQVDGLPVVVRTKFGYMCPDLAHKGQWTGSATPLPGCTLVWSRTGSSWSVAGNVVNPRDAGHVSRAIAEACSGPRHGQGSDERRVEAGTHAAKVTDAMTRARLLDAVDGWAAILGDLVDADPAHGRLHAVADPDIESRALVVACPSTGRQYVHLVPSEVSTAEAGRRWIMEIPEGEPFPDVET